MDPQIDEYIRQNRDRYTREAIRDQLTHAGHDPAAVDAAWDRLAASSPASLRTVGWRPGWREFLALLVVGAIGAALVWAGGDYGAGLIAPVVYAVIFAIGFGIAKLTSILVDQGRNVAAAVLLAVAAALSAYLGFISGPSAIAVVAAAVLGLLAIGFFVFGSRNRDVLATIAAALPIVVWLGVTGTCYAPLVAQWM
jgi:hypothetical protein